MRSVLMLMITILVTVAGAYAEDLVIVGTGSSANILVALGQEFTSQNPDITIVVPPSIGSGGGIKAVGNDDFIVGRIARDLSAKEQRHGLTVLRIARVPIVFFVNNSVSLKSITSEQVCNIYAGTTRKWEDTGANQGKVKVIRREDGDSSLEIILKEIAGFSEISITKRSKTIYYDLDTVNEAKEQEGSIAFGAWPNTMDESGITVLTLDGLHPTDLQYSCTGDLSLIYKKKNVNGALSKFITFLSTPAAGQVIITSGGLPVE